MSVRVVLLLALGGCVLAPAAERPSTVVSEAATTLPLAYDVDVVVAGGSLAGVEAACAAAEQGASVLLVESRPYLGYDLCGTQRLWIAPDETPRTAITIDLFQSKHVVTPLAVKRALDAALIERGVMFLTGSFASELLERPDGSPAGLVIANRSGNQVVRAKVIIDATKNAAIARQSSAKFKVFKAGLKEFEYLVVGGSLAEGVTGWELPNVRYTSGTGKKTKSYPVYHYTLNLEMAADTFGALSNALSAARSAVYQETMEDHSEHLIYYPENTIVAETEVGETEVEADAVPLGAFKPAGVDALYVLSHYADLRRDATKRLMRPSGAAVIGRRIGIEAAKTATHRPTSSKMGHLGAPTGRADLLASVSPAIARFRECPEVRLGKHGLPILGTYDVVVTGGGTSGAPAGIGAARCGAKTLVLEYLDELGGVGTAGMISKYWYGHHIGFTREVPGKPQETWNIIQKAEWYRSELRRAGADIWFGSFGCGAVLKENKVSGVIVATPYGRGVVLADVVIDATGNADIAAGAGAPTEFSISALGDLNVQVAGHPHRSLGDHHRNTAYAMTDDRDVLDIWHLLVMQRQAHASKPAPLYYDMAQMIDSRERRRIVGDYTLTTMDILLHRTFSDTINHHRSNFDAGALPSDAMLYIKDMKGPVYTCDMPLRCLTPRGIEGLLVVGLGASTHRDAMTLTRMQPDLQNQGYAAGVAAAHAVAQTGGILREMDLRPVQAELVAKGNLEPRVLSDSDSFPLSMEKLDSSVKKLKELTIDVHQRREHDDTFPALAAVMSHPDRSIPLLVSAYDQATSPAERISYARILALLGDRTGKADLLVAVDGSEGWGDGFDFSSQREKANSYGPVDRLVISLGYLRDPDVRPALLKKLSELAPGDHLSHYKALCLAMRMNRHPLFALPLAEHLNKIKGHSQAFRFDGASDGPLNVPERAEVNKGGGDALNNKFKEVLVAALLFECGDHEGLGREILEAYTTDVNGHFAAYAHHVLTHGTAMKHH
jgi:flavin-dependent dehydrogenase